MDRRLLKMMTAFYGAGFFVVLSTFLFLLFLHVYFFAIGPGIFSFIFGGLFVVMIKMCLSEQTKDAK